MKMKKVEITVGLFMIAGVLALLMLALEVSGLGHFLEEQPGFHVNAEFTNIGGLKERAKVSMAGVVIGRVVKIELKPETFNAMVIMSIQEKFEGKIPSDSRASILTAGLLGDNYIGITPGFSNKFLESRSTIPLENTDSAVVLEQLISKFLGGKAMSSGDPANANPNPNP